MSKDYIGLAGKPKRREGRPNKFRPKREYKKQRARLSLRETTINGWVQCVGGYINIERTTTVVDRETILPTEWEKERWALKGIDGVFDLTRNQWSRAIIGLDEWLIFIV